MNAYFNKSEEPMVISKVSMDKMLRMSHPAEAISLFSFYYYTAKWQRTDCPKASVSYCARALKCGEASIRRAKKELQDAGMIEEVRRIDPKTSLVTGWYVKVNFTWVNPHCQNQQGGDEIHPIKFPQCGKPDPNALITNTLNSLTTDTKDAPVENLKLEIEEKEVGDPIPLPPSPPPPPAKPPRKTPSKKAAFVPPSLEEVTAYVEGRVKDGNPRINAKKFFIHYDSNGWKVGRKQVDWKTKVKIWECDANGFGGASRAEPAKSTYVKPQPKVWTAEAAEAAKKEIMEHNRRVAASNPVKGELVW